MTQVEDQNNKSMTIILHAGNAQDYCCKALNQAESGNFENCENLLQKAKQEIVEAHKIQTKEIQDKIEADENNMTILFVHAQDTMMAANSEYKMTKHFISLYKRLAKLENKHD